MYDVMRVTFAVAMLLFCFAISAQAADMGEIHSGETKTGNIAIADQTDSYTFYGEENQAAVIEMAASASDLGPAIYLYRPDGTLETEVIGGSSYNRVAIREHLLEQTGIYTIVTSASLAGGTSITGRYVLSLLLIPGATSSEQDPDGGAIVSGQTGNGTISPRSDTDAFVFYGEENQAIVIEMVASGSDLGSVVYLYRPDGTLETEVIGDTNCNRVVIREHRLEQTGIYTIVTSASWAGGTSETGGYVLSLLLIPGAASSEQDPDGGAIVSGQTGNGTISPSADTDAFVFYGEENQTVVIEMVASGSTLGPAIYLYRPDGTLETKVIGGSNYNHVVIGEHHLEQTGIYTIVTSASWAYGTTATGGYGLSFIKAPPTPPSGIYNPVPTNGATIIDPNQSFRWDAIAGATGYDLYFGEGVITPLEKVGANLTTPEMPFPEMKLNKVYYWHVEAHIPDDTIQGPYWWFKTEAIPIANFTYCPLKPVVNETIIFNASASYSPDGGNITSYEWDFGDGNIANRTEPVINHSYTLVGGYIVNLTVTDDEETRRSVSKTITIMLRGDLNHDGQITSADALIALAIAASGAHHPAADVSDDNRVTSLDALMIMQAAEGTISF
uniref:PKD domain-containing protein n=1 Tax=Candidatus Methanogaster sp. ANME-2c ERB4 TaxID=2759911 RepID=A0A7G9YML5_9EURY|nr:hypothetical protein LDNCKMAD_00014 [Methanosarcinales archaeon ANME-2c ERB4]